jgi:hypothetical protein
MSLVFRPAITYKPSTIFNKKAMKFLAEFFMPWEGFLII